MRVAWIERRRIAAHDRQSEHDDSLLGRPAAMVSKIPEPPMSTRISLDTLHTKASRSEPEFAEAMGELGPATPTELAEFFRQINIPRTLKDTIEEGIADVDPRSLIRGYAPVVGEFSADAAMSEAFAEFHARHIRKLQWHASRPDPKAVPNVRRLYRAILAAIHTRLLRVFKLLETRTELSAAEWSEARKIINKSMVDFREATELLSPRFAENVASKCECDDLRALLQPIKESMAAAAQSIESLRAVFETRRQELTVVPVGYPPVRPAPYFSGDVLETASWTRFRSQIHECLAAVSSVMEAAEA
jgi:hypothetical protein